MLSFYPGQYFLIFFLTGQVIVYVQKQQEIVLVIRAALAK